jgi:Arc/MetJ family transcription regulator
VCYVVAMRVHITLDDALVGAIDQRVGVRQRSAYVATAVKAALDNEQRWELIESAIGAIGDDHPWSEDAAAWVHTSRREDSKRVG